LARFGAARSQSCSALTHPPNYFHSLATRGIDPAHKKILH